jgi:hypothetical protein
MGRGQAQPFGGETKASQPTFPRGRYRTYLSPDGIEYRIVRLRDESELDPDDIPLLAITTHAYEDLLNVIWCYPGGSVDTESWQPDRLAVASRIEDVANPDPELLARLKDLVECEWVF